MIYVYLPAVWHGIQPFIGTQAHTHEFVDIDPLPPRNHALAWRHNELLMHFVTRSM